MKMIPKTKALLLANKAESMAEVLVAFMVLTIILELFAQGMKFALTAENYAIDRTRDSDNAMKTMLDTVSSNGNGAEIVASYDPKLDDDRTDLLKLTIYSVRPDGGGDNCLYAVFDSK